MMVTVFRGYFTPRFVLSILSITSQIHAHANGIRQKLTSLTFKGSRVLVCGDGDMSFSGSLSYAGCASLVATTWDTRQALDNCFPTSIKNVATITGTKNCKVEYSIDATALPFTEQFDIVVWNFPHIPGVW